MFDDHCLQCALPLRLCGACRGVAGPFDRFCGFCGYELVQGEKRAPIWRLWLLLALVPLAAGLVFGLSPLALKAGAVASLIQTAPSPATSAGQVHALRTQTLNFTYAIPNEWNATDYSLAVTPQPFVVISRLDADRVTAASLNGELLTAKPAGTVMTLGRPALDVSAVDTNDPRAVLAFQVSQLLASPPPAGVSYQVVSPVRAITIDHRAGAEVVIKIASGATTTYYERAYVATGTQPLFRAEAAAPAADWDTTDAGRIRAVIQSLSFG
jgi:hypothetical protein